MDEAFEFGARVGANSGSTTSQDPDCGRFPVNRQRGTAIDRRAWRLRSRSRFSATPCLGGAGHALLHAVSSRLPWLEDQRRWFVVLDKVRLEFSADIARRPAQFAGSRHGGPARPVRNRTSGLIPHRTDDDPRFVASPARRTKSPLSAAPAAEAGTSHTTVSTAVASRGTRAGSARRAHWNARG
jgi:hypothetical protein